MIKKNLGGWSLVLAGLFMWVDGPAMGDDLRWYMTPGFSYVVPDTDRKADGGLGFQMGVGMSRNNLSLELSAVGDNLPQKRGSLEFRQVGVLVDGLYSFWHPSIYSVYGVLGTGTLWTEFSGATGAHPIVNAGFGVKTGNFWNDLLQIRIDLRYRINESPLLQQNRFGDTVVNLTFVIPLGRKKSLKTPLIQNGVKKQAMNGKMDSDQDGVIDVRDECPSTPAGWSVNKKGCELDGDKDGIVDRLDQCPNSPPNEKVDQAGCKLADVIVLKGVNFKTGSALLIQSSFVILDGVSETLQRYQNLVVEIAGYTDSIGQDVQNQELSKRRADAVVRYLISKGVSAERLVPRGFGRENPIADNNTPEGRSLNRRVELHILKQ